jgi:hypothetical protein
MFRVYVSPLDVTCRQMFRLWVLNLKPKHRFPGPLPICMMLWDRWVALGAKNLHSNPRLWSLQQRSTLLVQRCVYVTQWCHWSLTKLLWIRIFMMARKNLMHNCRDHRILWDSPYFLGFLLTNVHYDRRVTTFFVVSDAQTSKWWMETSSGRNLAALYSRI